MMSQTNANDAAAGPAGLAGGGDAEEPPSTSPPIDVDDDAGAPPGSSAASDENLPRRSAASCRSIQNQPSGDGNDAPLPPAEIAAAHEIKLLEKGAGGGAAAAEAARSKGQETINDLEAQDPPEFLHDDSNMTVNELTPPAPLSIANLVERKSKAMTTTGGHMTVNELAPPAPLNIANVEDDKSKVSPAQKTVAFDRTRDYSQIMAKSRTGGGDEIPSTAASELQPRATPGPSDDPDDGIGRNVQTSAMGPAIRPPPPSMLPRDPSASAPLDSLAPLFHTVEARRVEEGPVYDAIQLEEERWAKRHQMKITGGLVFLLTATVVALGVAFGIAGNGDGGDDDATAQVVVSMASSPPSGSASPSFPPTVSLAQSGRPTMHPRQCFVDLNELQAAVDDYTAGGFSCRDGKRECEVIQTYGWPIGSWCVSNVTDMTELFMGKENFTDDLSSWDTSQVTNMFRMFKGASSFDRDVSNWNTASVTDMASMFSGASAFNGDVSNWETSKVTRMRVMFHKARSFNGDVSNWNTSSVTDMGWMFRRASSFDRDVSKWDTSSVTDMYYMFSEASSFNGDVSNWETSSVISMSEMFSEAISFDGDVSSWNTASVTTMYAMFRGATSFNGDVSNWNTASVAHMGRMFRRASSFNGDVSNWNTSSVTGMPWMFNVARAFNQSLCAWGNDFPYNSAKQIFLNSGCTFEDDPQLTQKGPFCASTCIIDN